MTIEQTLPYIAHSPTSRAAAESMRGKSNGLRAKVLEFIKANGPVTDAQIIAALGNPNSIRPRRVELVELKQVHQAGTVLQANNRRAATWVAI